VPPLNQSIHVVTISRLAAMPPILNLILQLKSCDIENSCDLATKFESTKGDGNSLKIDKALCMCLFDN
jgi:hypothetical protein